MDYVAILHHVFPSIQTQQPFLPGRGQGTDGHQVVVRDDLGLNLLYTASG